MKIKLTTYENNMIDSLDKIMESELFTGPERIIEIKEVFQKIKNHNQI